MRIVPLELREANELVAQLHCHHKPVQGHRFSIGAIKDDKLVGAAIVGRPVSRMYDQSKTLEITRLVTDGTYNACSFLYSAVTRIAKQLGYEKVQTYILETENGASLKASNFICENDNCGGGHWNYTNGKPRRTDQPECGKQRWVFYTGVK